MRKTITLSFMLVFACFSAGLILSQQNEEVTKFQKIMDQYFDELWKFYPTTATLQGYHKYDNKLEDLSSKTIDKRQDALDTFNQELVAKVDRSKLSPELQIDHEIMVNALDLELIRHENVIPWEYNPLFYNNILLNCIRSLLTKDFAPLEARAKNASDRLKDLPGLIKQATENLKTPPQIYTEAALNQFPQILNFYKNELPQLIDQAPAALKSTLQANLAKAVPALENYQNFLKSQLLPRSTGNFRLLDAHARLMRITLLNNIPLQDLIARAQADYKNIRREMFFITIPFYKIMDPKFDIEKPPAALAEDQLMNTTISHVLDKVSSDHTLKEEFLEKIKAAAGSVREFIENKELAQLPTENLNIESMPPEFRGRSWTVLVGPGVYEASGPYTCLVFPFGEDQSAEQVESLLQEYNNSMLPFLVCRHVFPGQFVPAYTLNQNSGLVKKLYPSLPLIKGWPLLLEEKLIKSGYGNYDLMLRLNQLKLQLRTVIDFIVEFNVHEGSWSKEDALAYMMRGGFMTQAEAERKWQKILLNPCDAVYAYVGLQELLDLESEYKKLKGEAFSQKQFLSKVLSYGALPLRHLRSRVMAQ